MAPPFVGVAVRVTIDCVQIVNPGFAGRLTDGVTVDVTVIVIKLDATLNGLAQAADEFIMQATTSPCTKELVEYVLLFVPTLFPFNFH